MWKRHHHQERGITGRVSEGGSRGSIGRARLARAAGSGAFAFSSSMGANANSRTFYLRTKGETGLDLADMGFDSLDLKVLSALEPLLPQRYRIAPAERIAAMLLASVMPARPGVRIVESESIR